METEDHDFGFPSLLSSKRVSKHKKFPMRKKVYAGIGLSYLKKFKHPKKFEKIQLDLCDIKRTGTLVKSREIQLKEKDRENTGNIKALLRAKFEGRIRKRRLYSGYLTRFVIRKEEDSEGKYETPVKRFQDDGSELDDGSDESDQLYSDEYSSDEYDQSHYRPTEMIMKSLNPMLSTANCHVRKHNELLNRFYTSFDQCFEVDEDELAKDFLFPELLLTKPDLDFEKLQELPFEFRTSLVTVRSLVQKMHSYRRRCYGQLGAILDVIQREIQAQSLRDEAAISTTFYEELSKGLNRMNRLLKQFSRYAGSCNTHLETILGDVVSISKDLV